MVPPIFPCVIPSEEPPFSMTPTRAKDGGRQTEEEGVNGVRNELRQRGEKAVLSELEQDQHVICSLWVSSTLKAHI